jgi:hypothetical protein
VRPAEDRGEVVVCPRHRLGERRRRLGPRRQRAVAGGAEALDRHVRGAAAGVLGERLRTADEQPRLGIAQEVVDLRAGIGGVERQEHAAGLQAGQVEQHRLGALVDLRRHPVAGPDADVAQHRREPPGLLLRRGEVDRRVAGPLEQRPGPMGAAAALKHLGDRRGHGLSPLVAWWMSGDRDGQGAPDLGSAGDGAVRDVAAIPGG